MQATFLAPKRLPDGNIVGYVISRTGYANRLQEHTPFLLFNEAITELYNIEALHTLRQTSAHDYLTGVRIGYAVPVIIVDQLIDHISKLSGLDRELAETWIFAGAKFGDMEALQILTDATSKSALKALSRLSFPDIATLENVASFASSIGLTPHSTIDKIKTYQEGGTITLGGNIPVAIAKV